MDDPEAKKWSSAIGDLFLAFGGIEQFVVKWIRDNFDEIGAEYLISLRLFQKIELIEKKLKSFKSFESVDDVGLKLFLDSLAKLKSLNKIRNHVAHNPLCIMLFADDSESYLEESRMIVHSATDRELVSFCELREAADSAHEVASDLYEALVRIKLDGKPPLPITSS